MKALERFGEVCYNKTPERRGLCSFVVLIWSKMWLSKPSRRASKSNTKSNIFVRYCVRCGYLYVAWSFGVLGKWKGWKPLILLGFQPLLSSVKIRYFLLKSDISKRLENRLPKRHGGSNPSSCATLPLKNLVFSRVFIYFYGWFSKIASRTQGDI